MNNTLSIQNISRTIRYLILSDFFLFFAAGLLMPIYAVFVLNNIENKIEVVGYATACYWLTRVIMVIPLSRLMDTLKGELDEYMFMLLGTITISLVPLLYIFSSEPYHIYLLRIVEGIGYSMAVPAWRILFTNHIDRKVIGFEWSLEDVAMGLATAGSAAVGVLIVDRFGFNTLFGVISLFGMTSALVLLLIGSNRRDIVRRLIRNNPNRAPLKVDEVK